MHSLSPECPDQIGLIERLKTTACRTEVPAQCEAPVWSRNQRDNDPEQLSRHAHCYPPGRGVSPVNHSVCPIIVRPGSIEPWMNGLSCCGQHMSQSQVLLSSVPKGRAHTMQIHHVNETPSLQSSHHPWAQVHQGKPSRVRQ